MSIRQQLHIELNIISNGSPEYPYNAWWQMLEDTVTEFAQRRKFTWMNPNEEVHRWLRTQQRIQTKENTKIPK